MERRRAEEEKKASELEANYDEYNNYMNMIGKMLGIDEAKIAAEQDKPQRQPKKKGIAFDVNFDEE